MRFEFTDYSFILGSRYEFSEVGDEAGRNQLRHVRLNGAYFHAFESRNIAEAFACIEQNKSFFEACSRRKCRRKVFEFTHRAYKLATETDSLFLSDTVHLHEFVDIRRTAHRHVEQRGIAENKIWRYVLFARDIESDGFELREKLLQWCKTDDI